MYILYIGTKYVLSTGTHFYLVFYYARRADDDVRMFMLYTIMVFTFDYYRDSVAFVNGNQVLQLQEITKALLVLYVPTHEDTRHSFVFLFIYFCYLSHFQVG